jgi:hypothetical protein
MSALMAAVLLAAGASTPQAAPSQGAAAVSVSELKAMHAKMLAEIKAIVFEERVVELRNPRPNQDEQLRTNMIASFTNLHQNATTDPELSAAHRFELEARFQQYLAGVEPTVLVTRLNRAVALERRTAIDLTHRILRCDTRDRRDVDRIGTQHGLDVLALNSLDQTGVLIRKTDGCVQLMPRADKLATTSSERKYNLDELVYKFGLIPPWVFSSDLELELKELVPTVPDELQLVGRRGSAVVFTATVRPDLGYRITTCRTYMDDTGKSYQDDTVSDFRKSGDFLIPFRTCRIVNLVDALGWVVERREVTSAEVNTVIPGDTFATPGDYRTQERDGVQAN